MLGSAGADRRPLPPRARRRAAERAAATPAGQWRVPLADGVARRAREVALATLSGATAVEIAIVDRTGEFLARAGQ